VQLAPTYKKLAKRFKDVDSVVIAKVRWAAPRCGSSLHLSRSGHGKDCWLVIVKLLDSSICRSESNAPLVEGMHVIRDTVHNARCQHRLT